MATLWCQYRTGKGLVSPSHFSGCKIVCSSWHRLNTHSSESRSLTCSCLQSHPKVGFLFMSGTCPSQHLLSLKSSELFQDGFPRLLYTVSQCPADGTPAFGLCVQLFSRCTRGCLKSKIPSWAACLALLGRKMATFAGSGDLSCSGTYQSWGGEL